VADGAERGHVERAAHAGSPSADEAHALVRTAIAVVRRQASQRGGLPVGQRARFEPRTSVTN
jgi:hypothetical protein